MLEFDLEPAEDDGVSMSDTDPSGWERESRIVASNVRKVFTPLVSIQQVEAFQRALRVGMSDKMKRDTGTLLSDRFPLHR